ncbi:unnamed protein product [Cylicostephanus goldi]|uniref:Uncharacterized protein n=1 Tax=Cylicostephanus goldi TaxID=71465 RepID=A0A3P6ST89_CYLGO|nr:unnamed protein product [Cylicostephanus goldi]
MVVITPIVLGITRPEAETRASDRKTPYKHLEPSYYRMNKVKFSTTSAFSSSVHKRKNVVESLEDRITAGTMMKMAVINW